MVEHKNSASRSLVNLAKWWFDGTAIYGYCNIFFHKLSYIYIDGLKLRMRTWKRHSTRAKLKNCILPAFRNLECVPPPRMKLFGNQQLECLQGHMFFPGRNTYISQTLQVTIKKVVYHIIFIVLAIVQGIWRFWVYECTCLRISHYFLCTLQVWVLLLAFPIR